MNWKILALGIPLAAALVACPPPPVTPSYTLAIDQASLTFNKPTLTPQVVNLTITPKDGFSSDLTATLVIPSGSDGITATDVTIPAGATTAQLSVAISSTATEVANQAFFVKTTGGGLDPQTQALSITVNKAGTPPTPNFAVTLTNVQAITKPGTGTSAAQNVATITVTPSNGFTGNVAVSVTGAPAGVTFNALNVNVTGATAATGTLQATVASTATATTTNGLVVKGASGSLNVTATPALNLVVNPTPPPTVADNIVLTAPTGFNGKLVTNANPVLFTAQARNGTTVLAQQPTFTWASSDPAVVVDANGNVTAKKFASNVTITAKAGSVTSNAVTITLTYGMEASVGTFNSVPNNGNNPKVGTAFLFRLRDASGIVISSKSVSYDISATGWNGGATATVDGSTADVLGLGTGNSFGIVRTPPAISDAGIPAVEGVYTLMASTYTAKPQIAAGSLSTLLPAPDITAPISGTTVTATWPHVMGAASYRVQLFKKNGSTITNVTPNLDGADNQVTEGRTYPGLTVATGDQFYVRVVAYPVDITGTDVTLPTQFNISSSDSTYTTAAP